MNSTASLGPPTLSSGAIFSNGSSLWLYGGCSYRASSLAFIPPNDIWRYDIADGRWTRSYPTGDPVQRLCRGMSVQVYQSKAFYLGGQVDPYSDPSLYALDNSSPYLVEGILTFDESNQNFRNASSARLNQAGTTISGFLTFMGSLGSEGTYIKLSE